MIEQLGKIERVFIGLDDMRFFTFWLHFSFDSSAQGFGGISLNSYDKEKKKKVGTACGLDLLIRINELFNTEDFYNIKGRYCLALRDEQFGSIKDIRLPDCDGGKQLGMDQWRKDWSL